MARASSAARDESLGRAADLLEQRADRVLEANAVDIDRAERSGADATTLDRLRLDTARVAGMAAGLRKVAGLPDPVGEVVDGWVRPNGLRVQRVRVPLGVVGIIYENRPNVTSDAAGLCLKSGNAVLLRGSSSAVTSNLVIAAVLRDGLAKAGLPGGRGGPGRGHQQGIGHRLHAARRVIDCLIPRGGPSLVASVLEHATVPFVLDGAGNCHVYVDRAADLSMAESIVVNAKTHRPGVCNSAESLLVHRAVADTFLPRVASALAGVTLLGDDATRSVLPDAGTATRTTSPPSSWGRPCRWRWSTTSTRPSTTSPATVRGTPRPSSPAIWPRPTGSPRGRCGRRAGQCLDPVRRRRGARPRGRGRDLDPEAPRPGPDGTEGVDIGQVRGVGRRAGAVVTAPAPGPPHRVPRTGSPRGSRPRVRPASTPSTGCARAWPACSTWPTRGSPASSSWPTAWPSRCWSRVRPARARPSWPNRWPGSPGAGSSGCSATRAWTSPRPSTSGTTRSSSCASRPTPDRRGRSSKRTSSPRSSCWPGRCWRRSGLPSRWCSWSTRSTGSSSRPRPCCSRSSPSTRCRFPSSGPCGPPRYPWSSSPPTTPASSPRR